MWSLFLWKKSKYSYNIIMFMKILLIMLAKNRTPKSEDAIILALIWETTRQEKR